MPFRPGFTDHAEAAMSKYEKEVRAELLEEARRPVDSLTVDHVNYLIRMMEHQNKWTNPPIYFFNV